MQYFRLILIKFKELLRKDVTIQISQSLYNALIPQWHGCKSKKSENRQSKNWDLVFFRFFPVCSIKYNVIFEQIFTKDEELTILIGRLFFIAFSLMDSLYKCLYSQGQTIITYALILAYTQTNKLLSLEKLIPAPTETGWYTIFRVQLTLLTAM